MHDDECRNGKGMQPELAAANAQEHVAVGGLTSPPETPLSSELPMVVFLQACSASCCISFSTLAFFSCTMATPEGLIVNDN